MVRRRGFPFVRNTRISAHPVAVVLKGCCDRVCRGRGAAVLEKEVKYSMQLRTVSDEPLSTIMDVFAGVIG